MTGNLDRMLAEWRAEASQRIPEHFLEFRQLVAHARSLAAQGRLGAAAAYAEISALYAVTWHSGLFFSPVLERLLCKIANVAMPVAAGAAGKSATGAPEHVLHVATSVAPIGGHSRMISGWIERDSTRRHSLALVRQSGDMPADLDRAVRRSGGCTHDIGRTIGGILSWARHLRRIAAGADLVVLHVFNDDVVPVIALAGMRHRPPVIFFNHADHVFWIGTCISDVVANGHEASVRFSAERRGIPMERSALLPIILTPVERSMSRAAAKRSLGLPEDSIVLLSVARAGKYRTVNGETYADLHAPLLQRHRNAHLVVVGPGERADWQRAVGLAQNRIIALGERIDTAAYYQAADIYVDSFPFGSTTSLLEAGSCGVPLVGLFPFSERSAILGPGTPALARCLIRVRALHDYHGVLSRLILDGDLRRELGAEAREAILGVHTGEGWQRRVDDLYRLAYALPPATLGPTLDEAASVDEPDAFIQRMFGHAGGLAGAESRADTVVRAKMRLLPVAERVRQWSRLARKDAFRRSGGVEALRYLIPEWFAGRIRPFHRRHAGPQGADTGL